MGLDSAKNGAGQVSHLLHCMTGDLARLTFGARVTFNGKGTWSALPTR